MSEWIRDRKPREDDGPMIYGPDGKVYHYTLIHSGDPWKPIPKCEPYVKPKIQRYIVVPGKRDDRFLELQECEAAFDSAVCMSDDVKHIEAINAELLEALEGMLQCFLVTQSLNDYPIDAPCNKARAAIAKAKGEAP